MCVVLRCQRPQLFRPLAPRPSEFFDAWCPGVSDSHSHSGTSEGFDADGHFLTRRLQTYLPLLCEAIAGMMVKSLQIMKLRGTGPSGFMRLR